MNNMKLRLAKNLLVELQSLRECNSIIGAPLLMEIMARDAKQLAEMVEAEEDAKENAKLERQVA